MNRFIPMCIGNTSAFCKILALISVYPCAYREHFIFSSILVLVVGLSLCIQGTREIKQTDYNSKRFIPVHTGNTFWLLQDLVNYAVYPCAYREHTFTFT